MERKGGRSINYHYKKIRMVCRIMIDDLTEKIIKGKDLEEELKLWKTEDSVLEILTKLVAVMNKLDNNSIALENNKPEKEKIKPISKSDYLAISEFIRNYSIEENH